MTPKEKSEELFRKIYILDHKIWQDTAKQCALIVVNELLEECRLERDWYWEEVKQNLENL